MRGSVAAAPWFQTTSGRPAMCRGHRAPGAAAVGPEQQVRRAAPARRRGAALRAGSLRSSSMRSRTPGRRGPGGQALGRLAPHRGEAPAQRERGGGPGLSRRVAAPAGGVPAGRRAPGRRPPARPSASQPGTRSRAAPVARSAAQAVLHDHHLVQRVRRRARPRGCAQQHLEPLARRAPPTAPGEHGRRVAHDARRPRRRARRRRRSSARLDQHRDGQRRPRGPARGRPASPSSARGGSPPLARVDRRLAGARPRRPAAAPSAPRARGVAAAAARCSSPARTPRTAGSSSRDRVEVAQAGDGLAREPLRAQRAEVGGAVVRGPATTTWQPGAPAVGGQPQVTARARRSRAGCTAAAGS